METPNTIVHFAHVHVNDQNYDVSISMCTASRRIHIFKYNESGCDYGIFDNQEEACEFLEKPLYRAPRIGR
jgi:hypothetical protein